MLWQHVAKRYSTKWLVMLGFGCTRGMRLGEICAVQVNDLLKHQHLNLILEKSHIQDSFPLIKEFYDLLLKYIDDNRFSFKDGYLFPFYSKKSQHYPHMTPGVADAMMSKWRKELAKEGHQEFLDKSKEPAMVWKVCKLMHTRPDLRSFQIAKALNLHRKTIWYHQSNLIKRGYWGEGGITEKGKAYLSKPQLVTYHRISWHSLRRWFETALHDAGMTDEEIAEIMRYEDPRSVKVYLDSYRLWREEGTIIDDSIGDQLRKMMQMQKGQQTLIGY